MAFKLIPLGEIRFANLFDGRLEAYDVREFIRSDTTEGQRYLTNGDQLVRVDANDDGFLKKLEGEGDTRRVVGAIEETFDVQIVPEYWGFATQEELDAGLNNIVKKIEEDFYQNLLKYCRGEPHETVGMTWLQSLWTERPDLLRRSAMGYDTWDEAIGKWHRILFKYCRGEANWFIDYPGLCKWAKNAKRLVTERPELLEPSKREELLRLAKEGPKETLTVPQTPGEDDLPFLVFSGYAGSRNA